MWPGLESQQGFVAAACGRNAICVGFQSEPPRIDKASPARTAWRGPTPADMDDGPNPPYQLGRILPCLFLHLGMGKLVMGNPSTHRPHRNLTPSSLGVSMSSRQPAAFSFISQRGGRGRAWQRATAPFPEIPCTSIFSSCLPRVFRPGTGRSNRSLSLTCSCSSPHIQAHGCHSSFGIVGAALEAPPAAVVVLRLVQLGGHHEQVGRG